MDPTLQGFTAFVRQKMGIPATILPDGDSCIEAAFWAAMTICNPYLQLICNPDPAKATNTYFTWMVYNLGGDFLVRYAVDNPALTPPNDTYFQTLRQKMGMNTVTPGMIQSSSDQGTSVSYMIPGWYQDMTLKDQMLLQTPWGSAYLMLAQAYGPTIWGLT